MQTEIFSFLDLNRAAELLLRGELIAFPTETVYGLGACLFNEEAVRKIFQAKGRPSDNPLIAHVSDLEQLESIAENIPPDFYLLYEAFFPGPLTVVLHKKSHVPSIISGGLATIAIRMPGHPLARELIRKVGQPLVAPSANLSGKPSATQYQHVLEDFSGKIAGVIADAASEIGLESTVLSLLGSEPVLLRPGHITAQQIETVLGKKIQLSSHESSGPVVSPGMKYRHYAPRAPMKLFFTEEDLQRHLQKEPCLQGMVLSFQEPCFSIKGYVFFPLSGKTLYAALRFADQNDVEEILVLCSPKLLQDAALLNRLERAAETSLSSR